MNISPEVPQNKSLNLSEVTPSVAPSPEELRIIFPPSPAASSSPAITEHAITQNLAEKIRDVASKVNDQGIRAFGERINDFELAENVINLLKRVDSNAKTHLTNFNAEFLSIEVMDRGEKRYVYASYNEETDKITLIFDKTIQHNETEGAYKTLHKAYHIGKENDVKTLILTKERNIPKPNVDTSGINSSLFRERRALEICKQHNIPGTPNYHMISAYNDSKHQWEKQAILMDYYSGGNLGNVMHYIINNDFKKQIASQLTKTLSELHKQGICHNDLKAENIMLDEKDNAIIIDFGASMLLKDSSEAGMRFTGTLYTFSPELFLPEKRDVMMENINNYLEFKQHYNVELDKLNDEYSGILDRIESINMEDAQTPDQVNELQELGNRKLELEALSEENDTKLSDLKDLMESTAVTSMNPDGLVPQKNDDYALGIILKTLFGQNLEGPYKTVVEGLLEPDPLKRMTSQQASAILNGDIVSVK